MRPSHQSRYDTEFGANIFKNMIWDGKSFVDRFFLGNIVTQYYNNQVKLSDSRFGMLNEVAKWHTHGASNVSFTIGADTAWADSSKSRAAYVSRGPKMYGDGVALDIWTSGKGKTICGISCNF